MSNKNNTILSQELVLSLAEEMKMPLLQIARQAELEQQTGQNNSSLIQVSADNALRLIDNYILGIRMMANPDRNAIEAVSVSSVLYDTASQLDSIAKLYGVELDLLISGKLSPVTVNRDGLQAALSSLGMALIEALPAQETTQLKLHFASHRSRYGIVAGVYSDNKQITNKVIANGRRLQPLARQPIAKISHTNGAGFFIADEILKSMKMKLTASRHRNLYGFGVILQPNNQLRLV